jgi:hypothetical protein
LTSEEPDSGKSTLRDVCSHLVFRPNPDDISSGAAIYEFLDEGSGTILLDEVDNLAADARPLLRQIFNLGHKYGAKIGRKIGGRRKSFDVYGPTLVAGIEGFLIPTQLSRSIVLDMRPYDEKTKPEREVRTREWNIRYV